jgi:hypothetical protein
MHANEILIVACICVGCVGFSLLYYFISKNTLAQWGAQDPPPADSSAKTGCSTDLGGANCSPRAMVEYCGQENLSVEDRRRCDEFCTAGAQLSCEYAHYCGKLDREGYIARCSSSQCNEDVAQYDPDFANDQWCASPENPCYGDRQPTKSQLTHCTPRDMSVWCVLTQDDAVKRMCRNYCAESSYTCAWIYDTDATRDMLNTFCPNYTDKDVCSEQQRRRTGV